ncbi:hypothetical protein F5880DRAFT_1617356 [Lentinula raphanica]|nr:hypothetical protein F5880DRAFT_1617356 [Lentinula raphanica]
MATPRLVSHDIFLLFFSHLLTLVPQWYWFLLFLSSLWCIPKCNNKSQQSFQVQTFGVELLCLAVVYDVCLDESLVVFVSGAVEG